MSDAAPDQLHERGSNVVAFPGASRRAADTPTDTPDDRVRWRDVVGEVLRDERERQGRTLAEVADDAAVSLAYLSEIERGRKEVSSDLLDAVHRSLGLELVDVVERAARRLRPGMRHGGPVALAA